MKVFIAVCTLFFFIGCTSPEETNDSSDVHVEFVDSPNNLDELAKLYSGKIIYVDVWASWCGPCLREMKPSAELKTKFAKDAPITFVYINVSDNAARWKNTIEAKEIIGIHIRANEQLVGELESKYELSTIPRYLIIDKNGEVVDDRAPRPSDDRIEEQLKSLL